MDASDTGSPPPKPMRPGEAQRLVRRIAAKSGNIIWGTHSLDREGERDISDADALKVIKGGMVMDNPTLTEDGEWQCKVVMRIKANRDVGVVVILRKDGKLFVKTVEWEDLEN